MEAELLSSHVWQTACRPEETPSPSDFGEYESRDQSLIILRGGHKGVLAFDNACRQRDVKPRRGLGIVPGRVQRVDLVSLLHHLLLRQRISASTYRLSISKGRSWRFGPLTLASPGEAGIRGQLGWLPNLFMSVRAWQGTDRAARRRFRLHPAHRSDDLEKHK